MKTIGHALRPVKRRIRLIRMWKGFALGILCTCVVCLIIIATSFFVPLREKLLLCGIAIIAMPALVTIIHLLLPVRDTLAAKTADRHGLKERAQTAPAT